MKCSKCGHVHELPKEPDACIKKMERKPPMRRGMSAIKCPDCSGTGKVWLFFNCKECEGKGQFLFQYLFS